ncbi:MAG: undecaprenyl/decaprenyl-phosphate alpha-N-acetylglucosaminyl 1-phosphate transferase [Acidobacteria bacterium]|nr:undecaprenyl/decaprenyl-phosphate alpha-N-acetylglucosaminyl 1-phosphate transferase [Acidobacteriota bacterium]
MILALLFISAFAGAACLTPVVRRAALKLEIVDHPERRKMHHVPIPLLGGAAIVVPFLLVIAVVRWQAPQLLGDGGEALTPLMIGAVVMACVGAYDDWRGMRVRTKFMFRFLVALVVVAGGIQVRLFTNPLGDSVELGWIGIPLTVLWIVGVTNAMNLIDGLDGLAAGTGSIASLALCGVAAATDHTMVGILSLVLAGATLGFLPFNIYPAKIFLGDTGSMFLGFLLAGFGLVASLKASTATILVLPIVVLGVPVLDTLWAVLRRTSRKVSPFKADRDHIHHRLVRVGLHHRHVVLILYFICSFLGMSAYLMVQLPYQIGFLFAAMLAMGGMLGVWTLKYVEEQMEQRLSEVSTATAASPRRATPQPEMVSSSILWQSSNGGRSVSPDEYQVQICEIGRFLDGLSSSGSFATAAKEIREILGRRFRVHAVGAFLQEDRSLLLVLKTQPLDEKELSLLRDGVLGFFGEQAERWAEGRRIEFFRWVRRGGRQGQEIVTSPEIGTR